jgi:hypothetical protein
MLNNIPMIRLIVQYHGEESSKSILFILNYNRKTNNCL